MNSDRSRRAIIYKSYHRKEPKVVLVHSRSRIAMLGQMFTDARYRNRTSLFRVRGTTYVNSETIAC